MKVFYAGGTVGDTYVILCKLYRIAKKEKILVRHHTSWKSLEPIIREIYALLPNISVEFLKDKPLDVQICGGFRYSGWEAEQDKYNLQPEYYPEFELGSIEHFHLPSEYEILQRMSGAAGQRRKISEEDVNGILNNAKFPVIDIGNDKTSIKEIINIIRNSRHFYGPQGFLSFVAVSQKVSSTVFIYNEADDHAVKARMEAIEEWKNFLNKIKGWTI